MASEGHLRLSASGPRAIITLDRPDKRNMLEASDLAAFEVLLRRVAASPELRVLVITGTGTRAFCSGFAHGDVAATDWRANPIERLVDRLEDLELPTICALNGGVWGAAADLALACDFRIGVEGMVMAMPAARLGVMYNVGGMRRMVARLGPGPTRRILLAAETLDAAELLRVGFLDYLVAPEALVARTDALAEEIAGLAPLAVRGMKRCITAISRGVLDEVAAAEEILACFASEDLKEGLDAFAERRPPRFRGR